MKRVLVIGSGGSGKSTFSRRLREVTGLKLVHLDKLYWKPNWTETPKEEWRNIVAEIIKEDEWILDGNFGGTMEMRMDRCDTVITLDTSRYVCVYRAVWRVANFRTSDDRPDMAEGCDERFDWDFIKWIWNYQNDSGLRVEALIEKFKDKKEIIRIRSNRGAKKFFAGLEYEESGMEKG